MFSHPCCLNKENVFFYGFAFETVTNNGKKRKKMEAQTKGVWPQGTQTPYPTTTHAHLYDSLKGDIVLYTFKLY